MVDRKATTVWQGDLQSGKGELTMDSSHVCGTLTVSAPSRFEAPNGQTSPEELLAAAHASCFSMALSNILSGGGNVPDRIETEAVATIQRQGEGFAITKVALTLRATVPGLSQEQFEQATQGAKEGCPVSKALAGNVDITLDAQLV